MKNDGKKTVLKSTVTKLPKMFEMIQWKSCFLKNDFECCNNSRYYNFKTKYSRWSVVSPFKKKQLSKTLKLSMMFSFSCAWKGRPWGPGRPPENLSTKSQREQYLSIQEMMMIYYIYSIHVYTECVYIYIHIIYIYIYVYMYIQLSIS